MSRIALDAMGGDNAPAEVVAGAVLAAELGVDVVLVGDEAEVRRHLPNGSSLPVVHAPETIDMGEDVARALREKPNSSVAVCARLVRDEAAAGFVSAGSTGAAMAAAALIAGRVPGVLRPTIATVFPTPGTPTVVLDCGANPDVKAEHLAQFAAMGSVFSQVYFGIERPRVGLLNIGEEPGKGRQLERDAYRLLSASSLNFIGNVEGRAVATDQADVIVTDGFTGNVFLKAAEGAAALVHQLVLEAMDASPGEIRDGLMPQLTSMLARVDYENTGGANLIGIVGVVVIAHGSSTRRSIANALEVAREGADRDLPGRVAQVFATA